MPSPNAVPSPLCSPVVILPRPKRATAAELNEIPSGAAPIATPTQTLYPPALVVRRVPRSSTGAATIPPISLPTPPPRKAAVPLAALAATAPASPVSPAVAATSTTTPRGFLDPILAEQIAKSIASHPDLQPSSARPDPLVLKKDAEHIRPIEDTQMRSDSTEAESNSAVAEMLTSEHSHAMAIDELPVISPSTAADATSGQLPTETQESVAPPLQSTEPASTMFSDKMGVSADDSALPSCEDDPMNVDPNPTSLESSRMVKQEESPAPSALPALGKRTASVERAPSAASASETEADQSAATRFSEAPVSPPTTASPFELPLTKVSPIPEKPDPTLVTAPPSAASPTQMAASDPPTEVTAEVAAADSPLNLSASLSATKVADEADGTASAHVGTVAAQTVRIQSTATGSTSIASPNISASPSAPDLSPVELQSSTPSQIPTDSQTTEKLPECSSVCDSMKVVQLVLAFWASTSVMSVARSSPTPDAPAQSAQPVASASPTIVRSASFGTPADLDASSAPVADAAEHARDQVMLETIKSQHSATPPLQEHVPTAKAAQFAADSGCATSTHPEESTE